MKTKSFAKRLNCSISASNSYDLPINFKLLKAAYSCYTYYLLHNFLRHLLAFYSPLFCNSGSSGHHFSHKTVCTLLRDRHVTAVAYLPVPTFRPAYTASHNWLLFPQCCNTNRVFEKTFILRHILTEN